ncbi:MAG: alpha/beta hydrolase [Candidatus Melainabacteria bacterium]|nr:alpha/beta hydrolase [Candidatus Melainabacteria bacterium]
MILHYFDNKKAGPVVIFVHGTASASEIWYKQIHFLSNSSYRVIGIDLRGHGRSKNPGGTSTIQSHINDLKETFDLLKLNEPITIIGHSFGAVLAVRLAEEYPKLVARLLLVSLPPRVSKILQGYYKWFVGKPLEFIKNKLNIILKLPLKKRIRLAISTDINVIRDIWRESLNWDLFNPLPSLSCPVYLSVGRFDYVALKSMVEKLHRELPNSNYKLFKWASHNCMEDVPEEFNQWVLSILNTPITQSVG